LEYRTKAKGAALMTSTWMTLHQNGIKQAYFYRGNNNSATDYQKYGLFAVDGTPTKSALAFGLWAEFSNYQNRIDPSASASNTGLKAMAAQRSDGRIAVLVANSGTSSRDWTVAFSDTRSLSNYNRTLRTVDDSSEITASSVPTSTVFTIAPNTVQLLLLSAAGVVSQSDCLFNWAQSTYSLHLAPPVATSTNYGQYYYRYYSGTGNYLATSAVDNYIYVLGPYSNNVLYKLAPMSDYLENAGCP
jgi:hypothetical protein